MQEWRVQPYRYGFMFRTLQVAVYDLTLAYTIGSAGSIAADDVRIEILDELDVVIATIYPVYVDGAAKFIDKPVPGGKVRRFQRMLLESKHPIYGRARIKFGLPPRSDCQLSSVNLYRGNHLEMILSDSTEKTDFVESQVDVNSEIVPKGTIVAYTGGAACPPGFFEVAGIGRLNSRTLDHGVGLRTLFSDRSQTIDSVELDQRTSRDGVTDPRTVLHLDFGTVARRLNPEGALDYQQTRRLVNVNPWRYPVLPSETSDYTRLRTNFDSMRNGYWGVYDPDPVWVTDEYDRVDIQPGAILEVRMGQKQYFMVVSQYAQGKFITHFDEREPQYPFGKDATWLNDASDDRRRAIRSVYRGGTDPNATYGYFKIYGEFKAEYEERAILEVIGDWEDILTAAKQDGRAKYYVWKSGVVAHAQTHPELGDDESYGGYGYLGEPHSHYLGTSDVNILTNLGPGDPVYPIKVPTRHRHGYLFGSATLPKVRPVLLCQKI